MFGMELQAAESTIRTDLSMKDALLNAVHIFPRGKCKISDRDLSVYNEELLCNSKVDPGASPYDLHEKLELMWSNESIGFLLFKTWKALLFLAGGQKADFYITGCLQSKSKVHQVYNNTDQGSKRLKITVAWNIL